MAVQDGLSSQPLVYGGADAATCIANTNPDSSREQHRAHTVAAAFKAAISITYTQKTRAHPVAAAICRHIYCENEPGFVP